MIKNNFSSLLALLAHVLAHSHRLRLSITVMAQRLVLIPDKSSIRQLLVTMFAAEATGMPIGGHRLDHPADHKFTALVAARSEQHLEVPLAVFASLEFVENSIGKGAETLGATERDCKWLLNPFRTITHRLLLTQSTGCARDHH